MPSLVPLMGRLTIGAGLVLHIFDISYPILSYFWNSPQTVLFFLLRHAQGTSLTLSFSHNLSRPEGPKGAKDEVKQPEGPPARSWGTEGS